MIYWGWEASGAICCNLWTVLDFFITHPLQKGLQPWLRPRKHVIVVVITKPWRREHTSMSLPGFWHSSQLFPSRIHRPAPSSWREHWILMSKVCICLHCWHVFKLSFFNPPFWLHFHFSMVINNQCTTQTMYERGILFLNICQSVLVYNMLFAASIIEIQIDVDIETDVDL